jgi:hypothetical protein
MEGEKGLIQIEYEQISRDWRHRDSMLWQALTVSIALTGAVVVAGFTKEMNSISRIILFALGSILNWILLLKISKDHHYRLGSDEYLSKLFEKLDGEELLKEIKSKHKICFPSDYDLRIHDPTEEYLKNIKNCKKTKFPFLYMKISKISAFNWFYLVQFILFFSTLVLFILSVLNVSGTYKSEWLWRESQPLIEESFASGLGEDLYTVVENYLHDRGTTEREEIYELLVKPIVSSPHANTKNAKKICQTIVDTIKRRAELTEKWKKKKEISM